jgi:hypothetical protein
MDFLKFSEYRQTNETFSTELEGKLSNDQQGVKLYVLDLLDKTIEKQDLLELQNFIKSFLAGDANTYIIGLSNDSELFEFYAKYQVELDELLVGENYFDKSPKSMNIYSVYDYVTKAAKKALELLLDKIQQEAFS